MPKKRKEEQTMQTSPAQAGVSRRLMPEPSQEEIDLEKTPGSPEEETTPKASTARIVEEETESSPPVQEKTEEKIQEKTPEKSEEEKWIIPGRIKTVEDLLKSYRELEGAFTRANQEKADLERFYQDLLQTSPPSQKAPTSVSSDLGDKLLNSPNEAINELTSVITSKVKEDLMREQTRQAQAAYIQEGREVIDYLRQNYPEEVKEENYPFIDALAMWKAPSYLRGPKERYEWAVKEFQTWKKKLQDEMRPSVQAEIQEVEAMKRQAKTESPTASKAERTFSRAEIRDMIINRPEEYQRRQKEILEAYRTGKVR